MQTTINIALILIGAAIMLASVVKSAGLLKFAPLILENRRDPIVRLLRIHRILMSFFLVGYIAVALAFLFDLRLIGEFFVGIVFLFGAAFVFMGILLQRRMLLEIRSTISGIVPICSKCHKVREPGEDPESKSAWMTMEAYVTGKIGAQTVCPECMDDLYGVPKDMRSAEQAERNEAGD
jgi:hypothetical protein